MSAHGRSSARARPSPEFARPCPWPQILGRAMLGRCWELARACPELGSSPSRCRSWPPHPRPPLAAEALVHTRPALAAGSSGASATSPGRSSSRGRTRKSAATAASSCRRRSWRTRGLGAASLTTGRGEQVAASGERRRARRPLVLPRRYHRGAWPESGKTTFARTIHGAAAQFLCRR
jgi:hypothetical protein